MKAFRLFIPLLLMLATVIPAVALEFEFIDAPGDGAWPLSLNHDGSRGAMKVQNDLYLMNADGTWTLIGYCSDDNAGIALSADGSTIFSTTTHPDGYSVPTVWREATGWAPEVTTIPDGYEPCDANQASGWGLSGDGSIGCGILWDVCDASALMWSETTGIANIGGTRASVVSDSGTVIAGFDTPQRRPAYWTVDGTDVTGPILLHHENDYGEVRDASPDGQVLVGTGLPYGHDPEITGFQAFRYELGDTNFALLGTLSGADGAISKALHIAETGVIVGISGPTSTNFQSFIWTEEMGMVSLKDYLMDQGITEVTNSMILRACTAFSSDGSTLIGWYYDLYGGDGLFKITFDVTTSVPESAELPASTARLTGAYPNPFNPMTTVSFALDRNQQARVAVYNVAGRRVAVLADGEFSAGDHEVTWQGLDDHGRQVASGSYMIRLESTEGVDARLVTMVK